MVEYNINDVTYGSQGGAWIKKNTIKVAADLQKELCENILDGEFDKDIWKQKILDLKESVEKSELDVNMIIARSSLSKNVNEYGQPVVDGKTGEQKLRKSDGEPMFAPIPAHVKVAMSLIDKGVEIEIDDTIEYVVKELDEKGRLVPISLEEFNDCKNYSFDYYWDRISKPLIEISAVVFPEEVFDFFGECRGYSEKQLERKTKKLLEELEEESDNEEEKENE